MSTPEEPSNLFHVAMAGAETPEDVADVWHAYLNGHADHLNSNVDEMRRALHEGTPADVVRLASKDVGPRAVAAARRLHGPDERYKLSS